MFSGAGHGGTLAGHGFLLLARRRMPVCVEKKSGVFHLFIRDAAAGIRAVGKKAMGEI